MSDDGRRVDLPLLIRGDRWTQQVLFENEDGSVRDITGDKIWVTFKLDPTVADIAADAQVLLTVPADADSVVGLATIVIPPTQLDALLTANYYYDIQWQEDGDSTKNETIMYGRQPVNAEFDVTRSTS